MTLAPRQRPADPRVGREPGFFALAAGLFRGGTAWVTLLMMAAEIGLFVGGAYSGWRFAQAEQMMQALHWGLPALGMILMSLTIKFSLWPVMHIIRLKRQVAELELRLAGR